MATRMHRATYQVAIDYDATFQDAHDISLDIAIPLRRQFGPDNVEIMLEGDVGL